MLDEIENIEGLIATRTNDLSESIDPYFEVADKLENSNKHNYISRAKFIREQCNGFDGKEIFDKHREDWDVYDYPEDLITVEDFKRGFLWKFRDHSTSWAANQTAKTWFLTSIEAQFVRRYEFWICDNGYDECIVVKEGSYKDILNSLLKDEDYEVLSSPVFSKAELEKFIENYDTGEGGFAIDEIIEEYIECNPNYNND